MKFRTPQNVQINSDNKFHKMIYLSLILHFVVISLVFVSIPSSPRRITFGPVYSVQLVGSDVALGRESSSLGEYVEDTQTSTSSIIKREVAGLDSAPIKKEDTNKLKIEKAIESIKQKEISQDEEKSAANTANSSVSASTGAVGVSGQSASQRNEYIALIQTRVKRNWTLPAALMPKDNVETIIEVKISRAGALEHIGFEKSSGNKYFDDSALNAVKKSAPFPPFPAYISGNHIDMGIRFHSNELR
ncbi:MAG: TonB C-terminal domain-containing protein [Syntrophaceae bacterium]|nr:TonB C-terminal domain-containing protein [Syntrophaceae bacterium]